MVDGLNSLGIELFSADAGRWYGRRFA